MTARRKSRSPQELAEAFGADSASVSFMGIPPDSIAEVGNVRFDTDSAAQAELVASVRAQGILQPLIVVGPVPGGLSGGDGFELVCGSRRLAAALEVGLPQVPCVVFSSLDHRQRTAMQMAENIIRSDLNPYEKASGFALLSSSGMTQSAIADLFGISQSYVSQLLVLTELPSSLIPFISSGKIGYPFAKALLGFRDYSWFGDFCDFLVANIGRPEDSLDAYDVYFCSPFSLDCFFRSFSEPPVVLFDKCSGCSEDCFVDTPYRRYCFNHGCERFFKSKPKSSPDSSESNSYTKAVRSRDRFVRSRVRSVYFDALRVFLSGFGDLSPLFTSFLRYIVDGSSYKYNDLRSEFFGTGDLAGSDLLFLFFAADMSFYGADSFGQSVKGIDSVFGSAPDFDFAAVSAEAESDFVAEHPDEAAVISSHDRESLSDSNPFEEVSSA